MTDASWREHTVSCSKCREAIRAAQSNWEKQAASQGGTEYWVVQVHCPEGARLAQLALEKHQEDLRD